MLIFLCGVFVRQKKEGEKKRIFFLELFKRMWTVELWSTSHTHSFHTIYRVCLCICVLVCVLLLSDWMNEYVSVNVCVYIYIFVHDRIKRINWPQQHSCIYVNSCVNSSLVLCCCCCCRCCWCYVFFLLHFISFVVIFSPLHSV